jgi:hypothetical protein
MAHTPHPKVVNYGVIANRKESYNEKRQFQNAGSDYCDWLSGAATEITIIINRRLYSVHAKLTPSL